MPTDMSPAAAAADLTHSWDMDALNAHMAVLDLDVVYETLDDLNNALLFGVMAELRRRKEGGESVCPEDRRVSAVLRETIAERDRLRAVVGEIRDLEVGDFEGRPSGESHRRLAESALTTPKTS